MPWGQSEGANLRQQPKCGIARERENKERERENFPTNSSNLRQTLTCSQNKGLSEYQRRASRLQTSPASCWRQRARWVTARAGGRGAISAPEMASSTKIWADSQLLTKSSWDPGGLTFARRGAARAQPPRGNTQHTWDGTPEAHLGNRAARTREVIKKHSPPGTVRSPSTWLPELLGPGKGTKCKPNRVRAFVEYPRTWTWAA